MKINKLIYIGVMINILYHLAISSVGEYRVVSMVLIPFTLLLLIGLLLTRLNSLKVGLKLILIGSIGFVPIGLIAITGCNKILTEIKKEELGLS